uniref:Uncharacterized protein LOC114345005 n=1 Tax=Diabrotica virgifera virgifera TaxID=50390 RepID=A0A6P7H6Q3_DIAVI
MLRIYKVDDNIVTFLRHIMTTWKTKIHLQIPGENNIETENIAINRGLFQGDSLSPLWFCLAMNPLSQLLNSTDSGFSIKNNNTVVAKLSHLLYMDDLKLMASTRDNLEQIVKTVETFSNDINMHFGLDKCRVLNIVRGYQSLLLSFL